MTTTADDSYAVACRRATASARRRGPHSREWPEFTPPVALAEGPLGAVQSADREIARQTALRARAVAEFAAARPADADRGQGEPGAMSPERWAARPEVIRGVSEWAAQELVVALSISSEAAETILTRSLALVHRLPGTLAALEAGALHPGHLWTMLEKVAPIEDDDVRAEVEAEVLRWAAGRVTTPAQLGTKARREVARRCARSAARQLEKAIKERGIHLVPASTDGMAVVTALLTVPEAEVFYRALAAYADAVTDDPDSEPRTRGQKMADCLMDLVVRPGLTDVPPVQVLLTVVASLGTLFGGDEPGEVDGHVVPAELIRELLRLLNPARETALPAAAESDLASEPEPEPEHGPEPHPTAGLDMSDESAGGAWQEVEQEELGRWWAEMERRVLTGELGLGSEPAPDDAFFAENLFDDPVNDDLCGDLPLACDGPSSDGSLPDGPPPEEPDPEEPELEEPPADGGTWWRTADDAVIEAGLALRQAEQAMAHARRSVRTAMKADSADEAAWQAGSGRLAHAGDALAVLRASTAQQRECLAELLGTTGGGGMVERPRIALTHAATGALLALTDLPGLRRAGTCGAQACRRNPDRCDHDLAGRPGLAPPGPTDRYRPSAELDRHVRARDRRCRFPGCRRRVPRGGELDHRRPWPSGPTSAGNLVGFCTAHHRGKHQAPGWEHDLGPDGTLIVTTPSGLTAVSTPPPY